MKKLLLLMFMCLLISNNLINAQKVSSKDDIENRQVTIEAIQRTVEFYVKQNMNIELPENEKQKLIKSALREGVDKKGINKIIDIYKKRQLESYFYEFYPSLNNLYNNYETKGSVVCIDEGFEGLLSGYSFKTGTTEVLCGFNSNTSQTNISLTLDDPNATISLVSSGFDQLIDDLSNVPGNNPYTLSRTRSGTRAIRINQNMGYPIHSVADAAEVDILSKTFVVNGSTLTVDYAVVFDFWDDELHNNIPSDHEHPYLKIAVYEPNGFSAIDYKCIVADDDPFLFNKSQYQNPPLNDERVVFSKTWKTATLDLSGYEGDTLELRIEVADCGNSIHGGYAYIDNINNCSDNDPIDDPINPTCPSKSCLNIMAIDTLNCADMDFAAVLSCANDVATVNWTYSLGGFTNVPFGSSSNPSGSYSIFKPLYLPYGGNWDNYYLWITANITLTDGSTCIVKQSHLIECGSGGGNFKVKVYPNPVKPNSDLKFEGLDYKDVSSIEVFDLFGNSKIKTKPSTNALNIKNLHSGIYIIRFKTSKGIVQKKIVVE